MLNCVDQGLHTFQTPDWSRKQFPDGALKQRFVRVCVTVREVGSGLAN